MFSNATATRAFHCRLANTGQVRGEEGQANTLANLVEVSSSALVAWNGFGDRLPTGGPETTGIDGNAGPFDVSPILPIAHLR